MSYSNVITFPYYLYIEKDNNHKASRLPFHIKCKEAIISI